MKGLGNSNSSIRKMVLTFVGAFVVLSLFASTLSLFQITSVNQNLDAINKTTVPLTRLLAKMRSDSDILKRELERRLGFSRWKDEFWRPQPVPRWIEEIFHSELQRAQELAANPEPWASEKFKKRFQKWLNRISNEFNILKSKSAELYLALKDGNQKKALLVYPKWMASLDQWSREIRWGVRESERSIRRSFSQAQDRVTDLRTGLQFILAIVVLLSLFLLWLGERALRPLNQLTLLAKDITRRGLKRDDKNQMPQVPLNRDDEVSRLAIEFRRMATALLEREKMVEQQKRRLEENNRLLVQLGHLNQNVLESIQSILIVIDMKGKITQCNPAAATWLSLGVDKIVGSQWSDWEISKTSQLQVDLEQIKTGLRVEVFENNQRIFGGHWMPLRSDIDQPSGAILVLEDLTEERVLEDRLRLAESLAAVGRLSAQVAHEVRNPLHSIGLEAEMALDSLKNKNRIATRQSVKSILESVDRLEKITENYLKFSRLSAGRKKKVHVIEILEKVLATYAPVCGTQDVSVNWIKEERSNDVIKGDSDLLEQVLGNLMRNSLQAIEDLKNGKIVWKLGNTEGGKLWIMIEDNGPGVLPEFEKKLFQPFVTSKAQGTGLGLSFIRRVIEEHQGEISYQKSKDLGGAIFEIKFPQYLELRKIKSEDVHV